MQVCRQRGVAPESKTFSKSTTNSNDVEVGTGPTTRKYFT